MERGGLAESCQRWSICNYLERFRQRRRKIGHGQLTNIGGLPACDLERITEDVKRDAVGKCRTEDTVEVIAQKVRPRAWSAGAEQIRRGDVPDAEVAQDACAKRLAVDREIPLERWIQHFEVAVRC